MTTSRDPLDFGLPEPVVLAARAPAGHRKPEQAAAIVDFYRAGDAEFWKRKQAVADRRRTPARSIPSSPSFAKPSAPPQQPIRLDPYLVQLREDAQTSARQTENKRLTVAQDLTWALINSPASSSTINRKSSF